MTKDEILTAIEAQQMIQQRNRPSSERWREASENLAALGKMLNEHMTRERKEKE